MPIYEYACRECGVRFERMRKTEERLQAQPCPTCGNGSVLVMSSPGRVGASVAAALPRCEGGSGPCCGGGGCGH